MKVTLRVNGRDMTFSEVENIIIAEEKISSEETEQETKAYEVADTPTEGKLFKVTPKAIDSKLFQKKRKDSRQEATRQLILEALEEVKNNPEKYAEPFETLMPEKTWSSRTVNELEELAVKLGGYDGDWVEQAFEWAQRISNGESWKEVCNDPDTANWYRLVKWKNGEYKLVGGSRESDCSVPASGVSRDDYYPSFRLGYTVPFVVLRKKK